MARRAGIDWERVENDYRLGQLSVREIAKKHGIDPSAITRRVKKHGWTRDVAQQVRAATRAALVVAACADSAQKAHTDFQSAVELNKQVVLGHRSDITALRRLVRGLFAKIEAMGLVDEQADEILAALAEEKGGELTEKQVTAVMKRIRETCNTGSQVAAVKGLSEALSKLITLERQAFSLDEPDKPAAPSLKDMAPTDVCIAILNGE